MHAIFESKFQRIVKEFPKYMDFIELVSKVNFHELSWMPSFLSLNESHFISVLFYLQIRFQAASNNFKLSMMFFQSLQTFFDFARFCKSRYLKMKVMISIGRLSFIDCNCILLERLILLYFWCYTYLKVKTIVALQQKILLELFISSNSINLHITFTCKIIA